MVNPGTFKGARKAFLTAQKETYLTAVIDNCVRDCVLDIQRRYFKRFPIELNDDEEPSLGSLANVDDDAADPEPVAPDPDSMSEDKFEAAREAFTQCQVAIMKHQEVCHHVYILLSHFKSELNLSLKY
jgi:hypothetical protein